MADTHRYMGSHAAEVYVGDKAVPTEPGQFFSFGKEDLNTNKWMLDEGLLAPVGDLKKGGETE